MIRLSGRQGVLMLMKSSLIDQTTFWLCQYPYYEATYIKINNIDAYAGGLRDLYGWPINPGFAAFIGIPNYDLNRRI